MDMVGVLFRKCFSEAIQPMRCNEFAWGDQQSNEDEDQYPEMTHPALIDGERRGPSWEGPAPIERPALGPGN
jgi:hypothetical protein